MCIRDSNYIDLAWAAQEILERAVVSLVNHTVDQTGIKNLCMAGGVAMNCKLNGRLLNTSKIESIFVQPASADDGTSIGAAKIVAQNYGDNIRETLKHTQYGPAFSNEEVLNTLKGCKIKFQEVEDVAEVTAELLARGKLVGWHQGAMELGARALGGRSILANPLDPSVKDKVNNKVKYRESWRPFCPSLTSESRKDYLNPGEKTPFMIVAQDAKALMQNETPAVVHVDNTVRPQTVESEVSERYHSMISEFGKKTGHPVVLNTSLNVRSEPIACNPLDTIRCFFSTGLDALVIENFVIDKTNL